jgi:hypothetical protein
MVFGGHLGMARGREGGVVYVCIDSKELGLS